MAESRTYVMRRTVLRRAELKKRMTNRARMEALKRWRGCIECGNRDVRTLQFDHVPSRGVKVDNVASMTQKTWKRILGEIAKCDVVCANCHAVRTFDRRTALCPA